MERVPCTIRLLKVTSSVPGWYEILEYQRLVEAAQKAEDRRAHPHHDVPALSARDGLLASPPASPGADLVRGDSLETEKIHVVRATYGRFGRHARRARRCLDDQRSRRHGSPIGTGRRRARNPGRVAPRDPQEILLGGCVPPRREAHPFGRRRSRSSDVEIPSSPEASASRMACSSSGEMGSSTGGAFSNAAIAGSWTAVAGFGALIPEV